MDKSHDEERLSYILMALDKIVTDYVDGEMKVASFPLLFQQIKSYVVELPRPEVFQKVPLVITEICHKHENEAISYMLQEENLISFLFVNFSSLPPPYQNSMIDMFETLVNYRVENALKVGPRYILMLVLYLLHAEFELAKKILHILIFFACERETSVEVGKNLFLYLLKNYPDQYDVNLNEGIFRILAILCELEADFCATLMENPFFTTEIKDKFESSNSEVEQGLRIRIFSSMSNYPEIAKELHTIGIVKLVYEQLPVLDIASRRSAVTFLMKMCSYTSILSEVEKDWCMQRIIGMLKRPLPQSVKKVILDMMTNYFTRTRPQAKYLLDNDVIEIANSNFVDWQGNEEIIHCLEDLITNMANILGQDVIAEKLDFPALAAVPLQPSYNLLMSQIPCCTDPVACINVIKVRIENENIVDRALIQLLEIVTTSLEGRIKFIQSRAITYLVHLMKNPSPYEFRGHLINAIAQCFPSDFLCGYDDSWAEPSSEHVIREMIMNHTITMDKNQFLRDALMVDLDAPDGRECLVQKLQEQRKQFLNS